MTLPSSVLQSQTLFIRQKSVWAKHQKRKWKNVFFRIPLWDTYFHLLPFLKCKRNGWIISSPNFSSWFLFFFGFLIFVFFGPVLSRLSRISITQKTAIRKVRVTKWRKEERCQCNLKSSVNFIILPFFALKHGDKHVTVTNSNTLLHFHFWADV